MRRWARRLKAVVVRGDSMAPTLRDGDCVIVWRGVVRPGDVVVAVRPQRVETGEEMLVVKRVAWREDGGWWLVSDNPAAPGSADSFHFGAVPDANICGRVVMRYFPFTRFTVRFSMPPGDDDRPIS